jgi:hypothetical protein
VSKCNDANALQKYLICVEKARSLIVLCDFMVQGTGVRFLVELGRSVGRMVIKRIASFLGRRRSKALAPSAPAPRADHAPATPPARQASQKTVVIWESELRAIAAESAAWTVETGGDLFGRWQGDPAVFLATKAGPNAQRDNAHFLMAASADRN